MAMKRLDKGPEDRLRRTLACTPLVDSDLPAARLMIKTPQGGAPAVQRIGELIESHLRPERRGAPCPSAAPIIGTAIPTRVGDSSPPDP